MKTSQHFCFFCSKVMLLNITKHYCLHCNIHKDFGNYYFERLYKGKPYKFYYDTGNQKFIITNEDADWDSQRVMESDDLFLITPQNWEKKLPTILVFS